MNELSVFHADSPSLSEDANWDVQLSRGSTGAALGFPASAAWKDEGGGGGGGRKRRRRRGRETRGCGGRRGEEGSF